jgi:hypothetical protein
VVGVEQAQARRDQWDNQQELYAGLFLGEHQSEDDTDCRERRAYERRLCALMANDLRAEGAEFRDYQLTGAAPLRLLRVRHLRKTALVNGRRL